jgi:hypothetical protein
MLTFNSFDNRPLLTFQKDGTLIVADHVKPDDAGRMALAAMQMHYADQIEAAREDGRQEVRAQFAAFGYEIRDGKIYAVRRVPVTKLDE